MNEIPIEGELPRANAVSVYGEGGGADDFPVLKAFQQYIDSEQSKARHRMVMLSVFFGVLMCIVIAVFLYMLQSVNERNQALSDRLIEYAMKERDRAPVAPTVVTTAPQNDSAMKAVTDTLVALQRQMAERDAAAAKAAREAAEAAQAAAKEAVKAAAKEAAKPVAVDPGPTAAELERDRRAAAAAEKLRREREKLDAEKAKLAAERKRLHDEEVERQRRRLYPEYYAAQEAAKNPAPATEIPAAVPAAPVRPAAPAARPRRQLTDEDIADILREAGAGEEQTPVKATPPPKPAAPEKPAAKPAETGKAAEGGGAIQYFKDDEYTIPVEVKGKSTGWKIPVVN